MLFRLALDNSDPQGQAPSQRQSLDIGGTDEEEFGLWVAALRALLNEIQAEAMSIFESITRAESALVMPG